MSLSPMVLVSLSLALVVGGLIVVLRDYWRPKQVLRTSRKVSRLASSTAAPTASPSEVGDNAEVTIVKRTGPKSRTDAAVAAKSVATPISVVGTQASGSPNPAFDQLRTNLASISSGTASDAAAGAVEGQRWPSVESRWRALQPDIDAVVVQLNETLAGVALHIGPSGEASWSFKNLGFGAYRRITIAGRSVAWLRGEVSQLGQLSFKARAHTLEQALLNTGASVPLAQFTAAAVLDALAKAVKPAAEYAAWLAPKRQAELDASDTALMEIARLAEHGIRIAKGALIEAGADLIEKSPAARDQSSGRIRWPLVVNVGGNAVAEIHLELMHQSLDVTATATDAGRPELNRHRRLDVTGLSPHGLAEAMASCAWPAVADNLQRSATAPLGYAG